MALLAIALATLEVPLDRAAHTLSFSNTGFVLAVCIPFSAVGAVLISRQPANPLGWLLAGFALLVMFGDCAGDYSLLAYAQGHRSLPLRAVSAAATTMADVAPLLLLPLTILLFPDGRLSARWRWVLRAYLIVVTVFLIGLLAGSIVAVGARRVAVSSSGALTAVNHPGGATQWLAAVKMVCLVAVIPLALSPIARQMLRYRRAGGLERAQLKWLLLGAVATMAATAFFVAGFGNGNSAVDDVLSSVAGSMFAALPVTMGVAILRYRLYDIDRVISRTLSYAILTGLLIATFIGVIAVTTDLLPFSGRVAVAASTLVAAALFNPLRVRVQRLVDRRFNRARYDADAAVDAFGAELRDAVEIDSVLVALLDAVNRAVEPTHASVWIRT